VESALAARFGTYLEGVSKLITREQASEFLRCLAPDIGVDVSAEEATLGS
jgi:hypothetical protein